MSFGINRDYKTNARRVTKNLAAHKQIMDSLIAEGMTRDDASKEALNRILHPRECNHLLVWYNDNGYNYRCVRCLKEMKILNGVLLEGEREKKWWNEHGRRFPWQEVRP